MTPAGTARVKESLKGNEKSMFTFQEVNICIYILPTQLSLDNQLGTMRGLAATTICRKCHVIFFCKCINSKGLYPTGELLLNHGTICIW